MRVGLSLLGLVLAVTACDDKPLTRSNGTGGAGVSAGTGGTTVTGTGGDVVTGTGGTAPGSDAAGASDATASACKIPCLADLDSECLPSGACVEQATGPLGIATNRCYDNGVKILSEIALALPTTSMKITHKKPSGATCFTVEGALQGTTMATVTWKDAAGTAVATGTYNLNTMATTIMCGSQSFDAQSALGCGATRNLPRAPGTASSSGCTMGACM